MLDNERYDAKFLACANKAAAAPSGESCWCNATWLVEIKDGRPGKLVRAANHGLAQAEKHVMPDPADKTKTIEYEEKFMVVLADGQSTAFDPNDETRAVTGDLFVDGTLPDGTRVKSGLQLLKESASEHRVAGWCEIAGVRESDVIAIARKLTSHGKRATVDIHRGPAQHTNAFYNVLSWMTVNMSLGNFDAKGGMLKASTYHIAGKASGST